MVRVIGCLNIRISRWLAHKLNSNTRVLRVSSENSSRDSAGIVRNDACIADALSRGTHRCSKHTRLAHLISQGLQHAMGRHPTLI